MRQTNKESRYTKEELSSSVSWSRRSGLFQLRIMVQIYESFRSLAKLLRRRIGPSKGQKDNRRNQIYDYCTLINKSRDSVVGIATGYGLDGQGVGVRVPVWARIFTSPCRPNRLWGPPNPLSNGYRGLFPRG
jgi:hypothetical protein